VDLVNEVSGVEEIRKMDGVKGCYFDLKLGHSIPKLTFSGGRFGAVITVGKSKAETLQLNEKCTELIKIV
jgi:hypothetical protein